MIDHFKEKPPLWTVGPNMSICKTSFTFYYFAPYALFWQHLSNNNQINIFLIICTAAKVFNACVT